MLAAVWGFFYIMAVGKTGRPHSSKGMKPKEAAGCATLMVVGLLAIGAISNLLD